MAKSTVVVNFEDIEGDRVSISIKCPNMDGVPFEIEGLSHAEAVSLDFMIDLAKSMGMTPGNMTIETQIHH